MKKILALLLAAVMSLSMVACGNNAEPVEEEVDIQEMIAIFGDDGDGHISDEEGSFPYFISHREEFDLLTGSEIQEKIVGTWTIKDQFGDEYKHTFNADGTAVTTYFGEEEDCNWLVEEDLFYYGTTGNKIDKDRYTSMEVLQIEEGIIILYENDTNTYNGVEYNMDGPYAILVKTE